MSFPLAVGDSGVERYLAVDDQGILLRVTWRPAHGFLNVSLWRDGTCVETFHLSPTEAGGLIAFMATRLMAAVPRPNDGPGLRVVGDSERRPEHRLLTATTARLDRAVTRLRRSLPRRRR